MVLLFDFINRQFLTEPPVPTASFKGRVVIVTGANVGLGKEACRTLVQRGASKVIMACRNVEKGKTAVAEIESTTTSSPGVLEVWELDLSSYASVEAFAKRALDHLPRLDTLISNAGLGGTKFQKTEDNEELVTTNVVSLFLHAFLLFPKLQETAKKYNTFTHFTITSSELHEVAAFKERNCPPGQLFATLNDPKKANMRDRYNVTKLMEIFVVRHVAQMQPLGSNGVIINCVAPGFCQTELGREFTDKYAIARFLVRILGRRAEVGARTLVFGASAKPETHGQYLPDCKITAAKGLAKGVTGVELQDRVWQELKQKLETIHPGVIDLV